jgi:hypothetical protein
MSVFGKTFFGIIIAGLAVRKPIRSAPLEYNFIPFGRDLINATLSEFFHWRLVKY